MLADRFWASGSMILAPSGKMSLLLKMTLPPAVTSVLQHLDGLTVAGLLLLPVEDEEEKKEEQEVSTFCCCCCRKRMKKQDDEVSNTCRCCSR